MSRRPPTPTLFPYTTLFRSLPYSEPTHKTAYPRARRFLLVVQHDHGGADPDAAVEVGDVVDRKSTRLNSSHPSISYAVFCLKKKTTSHLRMYRSDSVS